MNNTLTIIKKALRELNDYGFHWDNVQLTKSQLEEIKQALKEKAERESYEPLTLEQLKQMDGESVWVKVKNCSWIPNGGYYALTDKRNIIPPSLIPISFENCLENGWILLRHKPPKENEEC